MTVRPARLALTLALAFAPAMVAHGFGIGLQPSTVELSVEPAKTQRQIVTIGNVHTEKTIALTLSLADWTLDGAGQLVLDAPGESERSGADWVRFSPARVLLEPGTKQDVTVEITPPASIAHKGDHRFALLATTRLPDERAGAGVWSKYQLASLFYLTLAPASSEPAVVSVVQPDDAPDLLRMTVRNDGDAHARLQGMASLRAASGDVVGELEINTVVLDNSARTVDLRVPAERLGTGEYTVDFTLNNSFAPQNGFRPVAVPVDSVSYVAP